MSDPVSHSAPRPDRQADAAALARDPAAAEPYPDIADYAVIGDCRSAALVSRTGSIDWLCLPHFSAPSVFAALLDKERGGRYLLRPADILSCRRRYDGDSAVLVTTYHCRDGILKVSEAMTLLPEDAGGEELQPQHELLRLAECVEGEVRLHVEFEPRPGYGARGVKLRRRGRLGWYCEIDPGRRHGNQGSGALYLYGDMDLQAEAGGTRLRGQMLLREGDCCRLAMAWSGNGICVLPPASEVSERIACTRRWWMRWAGGSGYRGPYRDAVLRSCITLKLLTYRLSGAVVAAATTSLPVHRGGERNWDYRYCWLRDTSMLLQCLLDLGFRSESAAFIDWLLHATRLTRPRVDVMYDVHGNPVPREDIARLEGYRGMGPVRIGNAAAEQLQLDIYGEVLLTARRYVEQGGELDGHERRLLLDLGEAVRRHWREPDNGIWEIRLPRRHNTHSKVMCWVALDALLAVHGQLGLELDEDAWRAERAAIRDDIENHGYSADLGSYVGYYGGTAPDASLLLLARYGYLPADHPRMRGTWALIQRQLASGELLYRYPPGSEYDGVGGADETFLLCSYWQVDYLVRLGEYDHARDIFERLAARANDLGLLAEGVAPDSGEPAGNFPQAFSHVGLVVAALALATTREGDGRARGDSVVGGRRRTYNSGRAGFLEDDLPGSGAQAEKEDP
ncbi:glycoside hydrolase family 15 protein [Azoarcus indigens]|uniref:GH15 family glucan-1,4-alpha-glucosidase n=1 Tax=Azoarcus indigens TaxID=29545 RepID=A0A4R6EF41_9RHOO|nr:glycoside hydrolase family 15 protein [Azoarcus indigens]NMG67146.1 glycoside hydrolase family 15 protein [Azoarcus indigens]TDN55888.1 GH15 family glucan-1,4-alpha-glucosidase [Azoarcus indigens]